MIHLQQDEIDGGRLDIQSNTEFHLAYEQVGVAVGGGFTCTYLRMRTSAKNILLQRLSSQTSSKKNIRPDRAISLLN